MVTKRLRRHINTWLSFLSCHSTFGLDSCIDSFQRKLKFNRYSSDLLNTNSEFVKASFEYVEIALPRIPHRFSRCLVCLKLERID